MDWTTIQTEARGKGTLVFAMRQEQTDVVTQPGPWGTSFDGYCLGLCAQWISYCYAGKTFPVDGNKVCDYPPWESTMAQTLADTMKCIDWLDRWRPAIEVFQMKLSDGLKASRMTNPTADFIHSIVTKSYGCYAMTLERKGGAHALAFRHGNDNRMHVFDANQGHFVVRDHTQLKPFLVWYLKQTGYGARYDVASRIVGVRPPIIAK